MICSIRCLVIVFTKNEHFNRLDALMILSHSMSCQLLYRVYLTSFIDILTSLTDNKVKCMFKPNI